VATGSKLSQVGVGKKASPASKTASPVAAATSIDTQAKRAVMPARLARYPANT
jgi:hypothetical protein